MTQAVLYNHTATLLKDGRVLVTGGQTIPSQPIPSLRRPPLLGIVSAEIYDPSTGRWSPTAPMSEPRRDHGAVLLEDGRVLVSGGLTDEFTTQQLVDEELDYVFSMASTEVYDPSTEAWSLVGYMPDETVRLMDTRNNSPAILLEPLENGTVLAVGGLGPSAALYDTALGAWAPVEAATSREDKKRQWHTSALLENGKVLYIGGRAGSQLLDSVELYGPLTGSSSQTGSLIVRRSRPTATVLADGRVLVAGGLGGMLDRFDQFGLVASAEIYDPSSATWSEAGEMAWGRFTHTMTVLSDGRVIVIGGGVKTTEIYDPSTGSWSEAADLLELRHGHTATLLDDGRVLVAGGASGTLFQPSPSTSAEVYDPVTDTWTASTEATR